MKRLLGVVAVLMGASILAWIAYNLLVERLPETKDRNPLGPLATGPVMVYVGIMWILGKPLK